MDRRGQHGRRFDLRLACILRRTHRGVHVLRVIVPAASIVAGSAFVIAFAGCVNDVDEGGVMNAGVVLSSDDEQALTSKCAAGSTVKGIDVSYYQGSINWGAVKNDGVKYAFIRVSDGTGYRDSKFDANWSGAKSHGVLRGAYQFFRSNQDPIAQADRSEEHTSEIQSR